LRRFGEPAMSRLVVALLVAFVASTLSFAPLVPSGTAVAAGTGAENGEWGALPSIQAPSARYSPLAVWTGSALIIWGGYGTNGRFTDALGDGAEYHPTTRRWTAISTSGALRPQGFPNATAVWTGSEMIVFGGGSGLGAIYNPVTDQWSPVSPVGAPSPRSQQVAVWTGREMIVWGGRGTNNSYLGDGARYNPATDTWQPISTVGASSPRELHSAVWDGHAMLVWGRTNGRKYLGDGAQYDPASNTWQAISQAGAPSPRAFQSTVWTGTRMIIWGGTSTSGQSLGNGASYDPTSDTWVALPTAGALSPRSGQAATWTGSEMLVWGGTNGSETFRNGAVYLPQGAPSPHDSRYFPQTGFRIDDDTIWDYFNRRGGVTTFGYPISRAFTLNGFTVQFFQRRVVQLDARGNARLLNLLDPGILPYNSFNFATVPAPDPNLIASAPAPTNASQTLAWVKAHAPDSFAGQPVDFYQAFRNTVSLSAAFPSANGDSSLLPGFDLEIWGLPTSQPTLDPNNHNVVYLRWQRGIMAYDAGCGCTRGMLLGDYLKAVLTGQNLPADLAREARNSLLYRQYDPGASPNGVRDPSRLPNTDLTNAFTPE